MSSGLSLDVLAAVLAAAALHATWNALLKGGRDPQLASLAVAVGGLVTALPIIALMPLPETASWPYIAASAVIHVAYFVVIGHAYRTADLSVAYPLMRGTAPVLTALVGQFVLGDLLTGGQFAGILLVCAGVVGLAAGAVVARGIDRRTAILIAAMVAIITLYTLTDGRGARLSGAPLVYVAWTNLVTGILILPAIAAATRHGIPAEKRPHLWRCMAGGAIATFAYAIALWAMTRAPIGLVAALRETSVLFAIGIGWAFLGEKMGYSRLAAGLLIVAGIVMMRIG